MTHDGVGKYVAEIVKKAPGATDDIVGILKDTNTHVVVNYLPGGREEATRWYVEQVLQAGCAFINCMPVFIASGGHWPKRFQDAGIPIIGDDIKSQVGSTIIHRMLTRLFRDRGVRLDRTYQLTGAATPSFPTWRARGRLVSKRSAKTRPVAPPPNSGRPPGDIHIGP